MSDHPTSAPPEDTTPDTTPDATRTTQRVEIRPRPRLRRVGRGAVALLALAALCLLMILTLRQSQESLQEARRPTPPGPPPTEVERIERYAADIAPAPTPPEDTPTTPPAPPAPPRPQQPRSNDLDNALRSQLLGGTGPTRPTPDPHTPRPDPPSFAELTRDLLATPRPRPAVGEGSATTPPPRNLLPTPTTTTHHATPQPPPGRWTLDAGTYVPAVLTHRVVSDQPSQVRALLTRDVLDSRTASRVLLPRGTRLLGRQGSLPSLGQRRLAIVWHRLILPDGRRLDLTAPSAAHDGSAGIPGRTDSHWERRFGTAVLLSLVGAGLQLSQPQRTTTLDRTADPGQVAAGALGLELGRLSQDLLRRLADLPPTVDLRPGARVHAVLTDDLVFP